MHAPKHRNKLNPTKFKQKELCCTEGKGGEKSKGPGPGHLCCWVPMAQPPPTTQPQSSKGAPASQATKEPPWAGSQVHPSLPLLPQPSRLAEEAEAGLEPRISTAG